MRLVSLTGDGERGGGGEREGKRGWGKERGVGGEGGLDIIQKTMRAIRFR